MARSKQPAADHVAMEFIGSMMVVLTTCSPGPLFGAVHWTVEWAALHAGVIVTDVVTGAHVNSAVTSAFFAYGMLGRREWAERVGAQLAGGTVGWLTLQAILSQCCGKDIGGPSTDPADGAMEAAVSEGFATALLLVAVVLVGDTILGRNYWVKMNLIAAAVRTIITLPPLSGVASGPAINPMIATGYALASGGESLMGATFWLVYWVASCAGALAAFVLCKAALKVLAPAKKKKKA